MEVRENAIFWAGQSDRTSVDDLGRLYERMPDQQLKEKLIFALSQRDERAAVDRLMDIARNETDPKLRKKAIFWLGQSDDPRVADFLLELIDG